MVLDFFFFFIVNFGFFFNQDIQRREAASSSLGSVFILHLWKCVKNLQFQKLNGLEP